MNTNTMSLPQCPESAELCGCTLQAQTRMLSYSHYGGLNAQGSQAHHRRQAAV